MMNYDEFDGNHTYREITGNYTFDTHQKEGGMDADSKFMKQAQSPEDGGTGIIRTAKGTKAKPADFYSPSKG